MDSELGDQLEHALQQAKTNGVVILATGEEWWTNGATARIWQVRSGSHPDTWHTVRLVTGASTLTCDCEGTKYGRLCVHRAIVHRALQQERETVHQAELSLRETYQEQRADRLAPRSFPYDGRHGDRPKAYCGRCQRHLQVGELIYLQDGHPTHLTCPTESGK